MKTTDIKQQQLNVRKAALAKAAEGKAANGRAVLVVPYSRATGGGQARGERGEASAMTLDERMSEAKGLARAIGLDVRHSGAVPISQPKPATLMGAGKVEDIKAIVAAEEAFLVVVDHPLSPVQQRNLELAWNAKVLDRTGLILEIFADRAQSKEGRLQVELARLTYQKSRLVRSWTHLERQRGGFGFLGGPGETQIEADRRAISERIATIRGELDVVERTRALHRKRRSASHQPVVALVGYTNAGKSTLFNALSGSAVFAKDMLFATLDPTLRKVQFTDNEGFILSDTVGFISELPTQLIAAFRATLEETVAADLILHVRDIASPATAAQAIEVERVLLEIGIDAHGAQSQKIIEVWNKADLLDEAEKERLTNQARLAEKPCFLVSARAGEGLKPLLERIRARLFGDPKSRTVLIDPADGALIDWLYKNAEVLATRALDAGFLVFDLRISAERERELNAKLSCESAV